MARMTSALDTLSKGDLMILFACTLTSPPNITFVMLEIDGIALKTI